MGRLPHAIFLSVCVVSIAILLGACSVSRALEGQTEKNFGVLEPGTHRDLVRAELGEPKRSVEGPSCELHSFAEGSTGWKYLRALGYSILDVGTLGVIEAVTEPVETSIGRDKVQVRVCYGADQRVLYSERLEAGQPTLIITGTPTPVADQSSKPEKVPNDAIPAEGSGLSLPPGTRSN